jgi:hypothetical protein
MFSNIFHLIDQLLNHPLLERYSRQSNTWHTILEYRCVTNHQESVALLSKSQSFYDFNNEEYKKAEQEQRVLFEQIVEAVTNQWGRPSFVQRELVFLEPNFETTVVEEDLFLRGSFALAYWYKEDKLVYVSLEHPDKELPLLLFVGARSIDSMTNQNQ